MASKSGMIIGTSLLLDIGFSDVHLHSRSRGPQKEHSVTNISSESDIWCAVEVFGVDT